MLLCVSHSRSPHNVLHWHTDCTCSICFSTYRTWLQVELPYLWRKDGWVHLVESRLSPHKQPWTIHPIHPLYMFHAIWQSWDCVAHCQNPKIAQAISRLHNTCAQSGDCINHACAISRSHTPVHLTARIYCVAHRLVDILDKQRLPL